MTAGENVPFVEEWVVRRGRLSLHLLLLKALIYEILQPFLLSYTDSNLPKPTKNFQNLPK